MIVWAILKHLLLFEMKVLKTVAVLCWGMCLCSKLCRNSLCLFMSCFVDLQAEHRGPALTQPSLRVLVTYQWSLSSDLYCCFTRPRQGGVDPRPDMNSQAQRKDILVLCAHLSPGCPVRSVWVCPALHSQAPLLLPISCGETALALTSPSCVMWRQWSLI